MLSATDNLKSRLTMEILYEDNHIIAINKSSSDIVQGDKTGDKPLVDTEIGRAHV